MRRPSPLAAVLVALALLVACGGGGAKRARLDKKPAAKAATSTTAAAGALSIGGAGVAGGGGTGGGGPGGQTALGAGGRSTPATGSHAPAGPAASPGDAGQARASIDAFLKGVVGRDDNAVIDHSTGAALALATVRFIIADINRASGGTTSAHLVGDSFQPRSVTPQSIVFDGSVQVVTDVTGSKGSQHSSETFAGPMTVVLRDGAWRVSDFTDEGRPLRYAEENTEQAQGGVHLKVAFALSHIDTTTVLIGMSVDAGQVNVTYQEARLVVGSAPRTATAALFTGGAVPRGLLSFSRTEERPTELDLTLKRSDGSTLVFSVPLPGAVT